MATRSGGLTQAASQVHCFARAKFQNATEGLLRLVCLYVVLLFCLSTVDTAGSKAKHIENNHKSLRTSIKGMWGSTLCLLKPVTKAKD